MQDKLTFTINNELIELDWDEINRRKSLNYGLNNSALLKNDKKEELTLESIKDLDSFIEKNYYEISYTKPSVLYNPSFKKTPKMEEDNFIHRKVGRLKKSDLKKDYTNEQEQVVHQPISKNNSLMEQQYDATKNNLLNTSKKFCSELVYPIFQKIKDNLEIHGREVDLFIDVESLEVTIQTKYISQNEFHYHILIKNPLIKPFLYVRAQKDKSYYELRDNLTKIKIENISENDIYQDFLQAYKQFVFNVSKT
ncbi:MAG: hypothetical protein U0354_12845 [Candidatus Sericytochromatia bacterium]